MKIGRGFGQFWQHLPTQNVGGPFNFSMWLIFDAESDDHKIFRYF